MRRLLKFITNNFHNR